MKIIQDPVPALKTLNNLWGVGNAIGSTIIDGKPTYTNGVYEGHNKIIKSIFTSLPFGAQVYKAISHSGQQFE